jgi:hypothetical protein
MPNQVDGALVRAPCPVPSCPACEPNSGSVLPRLSTKAYSSRGGRHCYAITESNSWANSTHHEEQKAKNRLREPSPLANSNQTLTSLEVRRPTLLKIKNANCMIARGRTETGREITKRAVVVDAERTTPTRPLAGVNGEVCSKRV